MKKLYILLIFPFLVVSRANAQGKITVKDANEIALQAKLTVKGFEDLLNMIAFSDNTASELKSIIENSYKPNSYRIFYNKNVVFEDDINPSFKLGNTKELTAEKYLNDFDLQYEKLPNASVSFSKVEVSNIKQRDYVYVKVKYNSKFQAKHNLKKTTYNETVREALVRMEGQGNGQWKAFIVGVNYYNPANPITTKENDVEVTTDVSDNATVVSAEDLKKEQEAFLAAKEEEMKKQEAVFTEFMDLAATALLNKRYKESLEYLEKARAIKPMLPSLVKKIVDAQRYVAENTYENFKNKGDQAKRERRFADAIALYKEAILLKPDAFATLDAEIKPLAKFVEMLALPMSKLQSQDYPGAISSSEDLLKDHKKTKNEFPELYYIQGLAYESLFEKKPTDSKLRDKAQENYNQAITYFPNYIDARVARAKFFVNYKNDAVSAIADYDVLTTNLLDVAPNKPVYYAAKAKLKDGVKNMDGAAADYAKAITLSPKTAAYYCDLGELQFRMAKYDLALANLSTAIKLNPKFSNAYYFRGLNYVAQKNPYLAGQDFMEAEAAGLDQEKLKVVEEKSNIYLREGEAFLQKGNLVEADTAFNNSLKIRSCNAVSLFNKAEIRFLTGEKLKGKGDESVYSAKYQEAIDLYNQAIKCNPAYSDAHYRKGLAQQRKKEYDLAISSFAEAIKANSSNIKAHIEQGNTYQLVKQYQKASDAYVIATGLLIASYEANKKAGAKDLLPAINAEISLAYQLNGEALYYIQQYPPAIVALEKALDYTQTNAEAFYYLGLIYDAQNDFSKANKNFNEGLKHGKKYKYYFANGNTYFKTGAYPLAISNFDEGIRLDANREVKNGYYVRGLAFLNLKQWDKAAKDFEEYGKVKESATHENYYADYGLAQLHLNKITEASESFNKMLAVNNNHGHALFGLGCLAARSSEFDKASEYLEKAYLSRQLKKDQYEKEEDLFLTAYLKVKGNKSKFNQWKKTYAVAK